MNENEINKLNSVVNAFKNNVVRAARANVTAMKSRSEAVRSVDAGPLLESNIKGKVRKNSGEIYMVSFQFPRHGIYFYKGVGRGWKMEGKKVVRIAKGEKMHDRKPKNWLNAEIDKRLPALADKVVEIKADAVVNATRLKI